MPSLEPSRPPVRWYPVAAARGSARTLANMYLGFSMKPGLRKFLLCVHLAVSVGWIGAVLAYLLLVVAAMATEDLLTARAAWVTMEVIGSYLIVPVALATLATGIVISLGSQWGLFRHYWVLMSLFMTVVATAVLIGHMPAVSAGVRAARAEEVTIRGLRAGLGAELLHAGLGLVVLLAIEALNVYKPLGMTAYGRNRASEDRHMPRSLPASSVSGAVASGTQTPQWVRIVGYHAIALAVVFLVIHLVTGGLTH